MKATRIALGVTALAFAFTTVPAFAQQQSKAQQGCINKIVKTARKISGTVLKESAQCIKKGAADTGFAAQSCLTADTKGKIAKAVAKVASTDLKSCGTLPDFGYIDAPTTSSAYEADNHGLTEDAFGDLDTALDGSDAVDPAGKCSATLPGTWRKLEDAMHRAVEGCLKAGLKDGTVMSEAGMEACLDSIGADTRGKIAKSVSSVQAKLASKCPMGSLATIFPGLSPICSLYGTGMDAAGIAACSEDRMECRVCRIFNFAYGIDRDCDLFDDGAANASCPDCGNGVIDSGETCDDDNNTSGDGCNAICIDEFCGDGVINDNGAETCDNGNANSNTTPGACRLNCMPASCGDSVTDPGEECDDGNTNEADGCTSQCTSCGNGDTSGSEECDDGNNDSGDCCSPSCTFDDPGTSCTGGGSSECTAPGCDGAGTCVELPANEGGNCDDLDECSDASECQSGVCETTSYVVTGPACRWAIVGNPTDGSGGLRRVYVENDVVSTGDLCGDTSRVEEDTTIDGDLVTTEGDASNAAIEIDGTCDIGTGDIVTNNALVEGFSGSVVPGLSMQFSVAAGQVVAKTPAGEYDTTGTDLRVADCIAAQTAISTNAITTIEALPSDIDLGGAFTSLGVNGAMLNINPVNVGGLSVIDVDNINGGAQNVTINVSGGGNANSVIILRVGNQLNTGIAWTFNLTNGLTAEHFLIYGGGAGATDCEIGQDNIGAGTIFCPDARIKLTLRTQWEGALFGGGTSNFAVDLGENVVFTHQRFTGF